MTGCIIITMLKALQLRLDQHFFCFLFSFLNSVTSYASLCKQFE